MGLDYRMRDKALLVRLVLDLFNRCTLDLSKASFRRARLATTSIIFECFGSPVAILHITVSWAGITADLHYWGKDARSQIWHKSWTQDIQI